MLGSPFTLQTGTAVDCSLPNLDPSGPFAWSIDESNGKVIIGTGTLSPAVGAFEIFDFVDSLSAIPEPDTQLMSIVALTTLLALRKRRRII